VDLEIGLGAIVESRESANTERFQKRQIYMHSDGDPATVEG
jgi:hypothetical protein